MRRLPQTQFICWLNSALSFYCRYTATFCIIGHKTFLSLHMNRRKHLKKLKLVWEKIFNKLEIELSWRVSRWCTWLWPAETLCEQANKPSSYTGVGYSFTDREAFNFSRSRIYKCVSNLWRASCSILPLHEAHHTELSMTSVEPLWRTRTDIWQQYC